MNEKVIALGKDLRFCKNVITLGVRPNFSDYSENEAELIRRADKIYYPSGFYADLFDAVNKKTFPSYHTYKCVQDKIKQTSLFQILKIPHPITRVFYGKRKADKICKYFKFPFIAKIPTGSAMGRGVFLIKNREDLDVYCEKTHSGYIQEYLPSDRDIRVIIIGNRIVHSYWRIAMPGEFRANIAQGGRVSLSAVPSQALQLALFTAKICRWDNVGIDIINYKKNPYVIEGNMKYGKEGFRKAGINYIELMEKMIENKEI